MNLFALILYQGSPSWIRIYFTYPPIYSRFRHLFIFCMWSNSLNFFLRLQQYLSNTFETWNSGRIARYYIKFVNFKMNIILLTWMFFRYKFLTNLCLCDYWYVLVWINKDNFFSKSRHNLLLPSTYCNWWLGGCITYS